MLAALCHDLVENRPQIHPNRYEVLPNMNRDSFEQNLFEKDNGRIEVDPKYSTSGEITSVRKIIQRSETNSEF